MGGFTAASDLAACLLPLLKSLGWGGNPRNVMAMLNYSSRPERVSVSLIDARLFPCLFLSDRGHALVLKSNRDGVIEAFDSALGESRVLDHANLRGTAYFFMPVPPGQGPVRGGWFRSVLDRFRPLFWQTFFVTLILNMASLGTPIFVMNVYDKVIGTGSIPTLLAFCIGARLDNIMGNNIFQHILSLPPGFTERATIGAQVARIKDFESVREFFAGPLALVFMELPFAIFYFTVIFMLGGVLALVPVVGTTLFILGGLVILPVVRKNVSAAGRAGSARQEFLVEMRAVKLSAGERNWLGRYREMSAKAAYGNFRSGIFAAARIMSATIPRCIGSCRA
ncbi:MAG TPA: ABC transporter transmembrane domain-containing protein [Magnetospirillum sp.]|nr:ABC transporter transmembrane domain-containing protein [Magnetospirillum sp.]